LVASRSTAPDSVILVVTAGNTPSHFTAMMASLN
jgi:hypothetical protein